MTQMTVSPFDEGVMAAETGMTKENTPYISSTTANSDWNAGYEFAVEAHEATELDNEYETNVTLD